MVNRAVRQIVQNRLAEYPAVALVGSRQCGKTTLAKALGGVYLDMEQPAERVRLDLDWQQLISSGQLIILDEAQSAPDIFPRLRGAIDADRTLHGRFLLLGSVSPALMRHVGESLAGRLAVVELSPFTLAEVPQTPVRRLWLQGGFPDGGILGGEQFPRWQRNYVDLLCQRDLPAWGLPATAQVTQRLLEMLAAVSGQAWNASQLGQSLGLSYHTVNTYCDYLEGAFLLRRLRPLFGSIPKRLAKSAKVYLRDSGVLHALLGVTSEDELLRQPWVGASWEGFVIEQVLSTLQQSDAIFEPYYLRTQDQTELDLVLTRASVTWAIEIKLTTQPNPHDLQRLNRAADLVHAEKRFLVSQVSDSVGAGDAFSCNLPWLLEYVKEHWR